MSLIIFLAKFSNWNNHLVYLYRLTDWLIIQAVCALVVLTNKSESTLHAYEAKIEKKYSLKSGL